MDVMLVTITAVSLLLACVMGGILLQRVAEERRRSEARVALLAAAAKSASHVAQPEPAAGRSVFDGQSEQAGLFASADAPSPWKQRLAISLVFAVFAGGIGYALLHGGTDTTVSVPFSPPAAAAPLELLSLRHTQETDGLTISGIVRNPQTGRVFNRVSATATVIGQDGIPVASAHAELDYPTLAPGNESPFVIKVPVRGAVSRYRIAFRAADGSVIAHVDRRAAGTSVRVEALNGGARWVR